MHSCTVYVGSLRLAPIKFNNLLPFSLYFSCMCFFAAGLEAMETALELEKKVNQSLLDLHKVADAHGDFQVRSTPDLFKDIS